MEIRLNKYLSEAGICSRREADRLIESGKVTVDGKRAETGMKVTEAQIVRVGKKEIRPKNEMVLLAVNKPVGIVCTEEKRDVTIFFLLPSCFHVAVSPETDVFLHD